MNPQHFGFDLADRASKSGLIRESGFESRGSLLIEVGCLDGGLRSRSTVWFVTYRVSSLVVSYTAGKLL